MASPTSRLLELLELLQARPLTTGREIADQLGIDPRTARRYVEVLQGLGIPVEGQRGVGGGYRIRPGYRLPPLMLGDEEAVVVVLGLLATRGSRPDGSPDAVDGALAKINRVLPSTLRRQVEALEETLGFTTDDRRRPGRRGRGASARRRDPAPAAASHGIPHVLRGGIGARAQPARPRRPFRPLVPRRPRSHARRPANVPGRPDVAHGAHRRRGSPGPGGIRRRRLRDAFARQRALEVGGRDPARPAGRRRGATYPCDARRARGRARAARSCECAWTRSTGWRPSSPVSAATSRSAGRTSCAEACVRSATASRRKLEPIRRWRARA